MPLKYKCLVLDHDDTMVNSTAVVHFPAFLDVLAQMRPGVTMELDEYFQVNFDPGFRPFCEDVLHFTPEEMDREFGIWQNWVSRTVPSVYPGMKRLVLRWLAEGGQVAVVSHSVGDTIRRDWQANGLPAPELIYGWELPRDKVKPSVWPLQDIMRRLDLTPKDLLMVDDLRPGWEMAHGAGVPFAAAMWAHHVPGIRTFMQANADLCCETPEALEAHLFG